MKAQVQEAKKHAASLHRVYLNEVPTGICDLESEHLHSEGKTRINFRSPQPSNKYYGDKLFF